MRQLLIISLCLGIALAQLPKKETTDKKATQKQAPPAGNQQLSEPSQPNPTRETTYYTYYHQEPDRKETVKNVSDFFLALFTLALVAVGILQTRVLCKHEAWMRRNVAVVRRIARAANKNADALIDAERAWIIASPAQNAPEIGFIPPPNHPPELDGADTSNYFSVAFKNTGKTPAKLTDSAVMYRLFNNLNEIPPEPNYGPRGTLGDIPLSTGDSLGAFAFLQPNTILTYDVAQAVFRQGAFLLAYGIVSYRDVFEREHETRFGYIYHFPQGGDPTPAGFRREKVPAAYNRAT